MRSEIAIAATLALTPLVILPRYFFFYDITPKIAIALIGISATVLLSFRDGIRAGIGSLWADPAGRAFCLLAAAEIASLLISTACSTHPALSWNGGNWRRLGFVSQLAVISFAVIVAATTRAAGLRILLRTVSAAGIVAAIYGIFQYFGIDPLLSPADYRVGQGVAAIVRLPSTLGHADYFAGYLLSVVFLGAALASIESRRWWKATGGAAVIAGSTAIVLSGTRGAMLGLATGAVLLAIWNRPRAGMRHALVAAVVCAAAAVFYLSPSGLQLRARARWALDDLRGGARLLLWRDSLRMAAERPLAGFGPETFGLEFPRYQSVALSRAYPDFYHESPHDVLLDALVSQGIPGFVILAGLFGLGLVAGRKRPGAPYLLAALLAGFVSGLFVCFTFTGLLYLYATIALLVSLRLPEPSREKVRIPATAQMAAVAAIVLFLSFAVQVTLSDVLLAKAKHDLDVGRITDAVAAYTRSQHWHKAGSSDDLYFSRALAVKSRSASPAAFAVAKRAVETSEERQNAWYNLAGFYATRNDFANVEICLRRSAEASPNWFKPHWALAQALLLAGRRTEAFTEATRAISLDGSKDPEIAKFLQSVHHSSGGLKQK